jgi:BirA family transcriptional regulator, biotin operon repressor / biotin---[acetyl-CoA-carboxylase] ligase
MPSAPREFYPEIASTQDRALELARAGAPAGTRVVAGRQTHGRGRLDHDWASPPGGLYLSIVLRSPSGHESLLPLAIGAHLAREIERLTRVALALKWPNDLLWTDGRTPPRKVAGVLMDRVVAPSGTWAVVVGIGVNVAPGRSLPSEVADRAISLGDLVRPAPSLAEVEEATVRAAVSAAAALEDAGATEETRAMCRARLYGVGQRAVVDGVPRGTIASLGPDGELWLDTEAGRVAIRAGDLRVEEVP